MTTPSTAAAGELLPCPFCGSSRIGLRYEGQPAQKYAFCCSDCGGTVGLEYVGGTASGSHIEFNNPKAHAAWNLRTPAPSAQAGEWRLDSDAAAMLRHFIGDGEASQIVLDVGDVQVDEGLAVRHGLRVTLTEYPDEGSVLLCEIPRLNLTQEFVDRVTSDSAPDSPDVIGAGIAAPSAPAGVVKVEGLLPRDTLDSGYNQCIDVAINALTYLSSSERPSGGQYTYNAEHLLQLASELKRTQRIIRTAPPQAGREDAQSVKAWAIVGPDGVMHAGNVQDTADDAWDDWIRKASWIASQDAWEAKGYRAEQVTISTASGAAREEG